MQIAHPYPLRSPLDPSVPVSLKDYSMTSPLQADGSNFPCKQYQNDDTNPQAYDIKAVYQTGSSYNLTLAGSATHMGGSCQISLSYDNGDSFKVIQSLIGGCPLDLTLNFTIPSFAPASNTVLLSWSWFNLIGNREMYQNCVRVQIQSTSMHRYKRNTARSSWKRQASMDDLPDMFACDVGNGCTTVEGEDVDFPNPGNNVQYGTDATATTPGSGFTMTATPTGNAFSSIPAAGSSQQTTSAPYPLSNDSAPVGPTGSGYLSGNFYYSTSSTSTTGSALSAVSATALPSTTSSATSTPTNLPCTYTDAVGDTGYGIASKLGISFDDLNKTNPGQDWDLLMPGIIVLKIPGGNCSSVSSSMTTTTTSTKTAFSPPTTLDAFSTLTTSASAASTANTMLFPRQTTSSCSTLTTTTTIAASPSNLASPLPSASASSASSAPPLSGPCTPGTFACNSPTSFSQCTSSNTYTFMGSVALGMQCVNGQIIRQNDGPCTPNGALFCNGDRKFYLCDQGGLIDMGSVALGTRCVDGQIVAA